MQTLLSGFYMERVFCIGIAKDTVLAFRDRNLHLLSRAGVTEYPWDKQGLFCSLTFGKQHMQFWGHIEMTAVIKKFYRIFVLDFRCVALLALFSLLRSSHETLPC
jgi:hypothetical protein